MRGYDNQNESDNSIRIVDDKGEEIELYIIEETRIGGMNYILVTDAAEDEDGECYILKDVSKDDEDEAVYEFVENEDELDYMFKIFTELMEDSDTELTR
jgi:uncharacterized protein YrzB (UPF0473 family)